MIVYAIFAAVNAVALGYVVWSYIDFRRDDKR